MPSLRVRMAFIGVVRLTFIGTPGAVGIVAADPTRACTRVGIRTRISGRFAIISGRSIGSAMFISIRRGCGYCRSANRGSRYSRAHHAGAIAVCGPTVVSTGNTGNAHGS
jgi:hypothetical protein